MTAILSKKDRKFFGRDKHNRKRLTKEDIEIVAALEALKNDIDFLNNCFDHTTDAVLVDSLVYEIKAANLKYQYYLNMCKEKGIVHGAIPAR
ncbi:MAG: YaaL family protein [Defluviitaleaceae bacterium]|nr:YaaL family protein [Defluviitaleaceae bacterium]